MTAGSRCGGGSRDPWACLDAIDRMDVGPPRVQHRRIVVPYRVTRGRRSDAVDLIYRWEEPVMDPSEPSSQNLAAMIGAQVAMNYGLFCRRMVFHGPYDEADRTFIERMTENTSREILVKKFLEPNPFLVGQAARLPAVRRERYTRAAVEFPDAPARRERPGAWDVDPRRCLVLSSGGKDSLLTFGLLREAGADVHPVFGNESGRHWFTALNAYRHFRAKVPNTSRVWMNSDRVFAWMLRRLPFIRRDFASVRSDEYPVRLWTVAVFLFGVLPLMRKRGIGRLVIGDEFDTSQRRSHAGIGHYNGLFDQSVYFDHALSRYFARKRWGIAQLSILRPLSEMLIEKILYERYPDLQRHQVSCHATHVVGRRVRPCGACEKCRRIVGMLLAFDADPSRIGYDPVQVRRCLRDVARMGVAQESAGVQHLRWLLERRGLVESGRASRPRPEILKLRFDGDVSPVEEIPADLRTPLLRMVLAHADGALRRAGGTWKTFDLRPGRM
jgi:hypothetical protein